MFRRGSNPVCTYFSSVSTLTVRYAAAYRVANSLAATGAHRKRGRRWRRRRTKWRGRGANASFQLCFKSREGSGYAGPGSGPVHVLDPNSEEPGDLHRVETVRGEAGRQVEPYRPESITFLVKIGDQPAHEPLALGEYYGELTNFLFHAGGSGIGLVSPAGRRGFPWQMRFERPRADIPAVPLRDCLGGQLVKDRIGQEDHDQLVG